MTIRFTCAGCGSLLKIKDDLAGTDGKCPKCKTEFVVPSPEPEEGSAEIELVHVGPAKKSQAGADSHPALSHGKSESAKNGPESDAVVESAASDDPEPEPKPKANKPTKPASTKGKKSGSDDDFDPTEFLMDGEGPPKKATIPTQPEADSRNPFENDESRPPPKSARKPAAVPAEGSASSFAKEMMMKAMEESRAHAGDMPVEQKPEGFDYGGMFRELGLKGGAAIVGGIFLCIGLYMFFDYMYGGRLKLPKLAYVTGTVTLDGAPLPNTNVFFEPKDATIDGGKRDRPRTSVGMTDDKGQFKMFYIDKVQGVAIGKCRVWLSCVGPTGQMIPGEYTDANLVLKDVAPGKQVIDFALVSKK